jgi:anoctamin-10
MPGFFFQSFIAWLAALTNSALVYLFRPSASTGFFGSIFHQHDATSTGSPLDTLETSIVPALLIALSASHGYIILRAVTRHILERALWKGSPESREGEKKERIVKQTYLKGVASGRTSSTRKETRATSETGPLWTEEGRAEFEKWIKTE